MTGDFTCTNPATCSISGPRWRGAMSISGYTFTSDANEIIVAAVASEEDRYLPRFRGVAARKPRSTAPTPTPSARSPTAGPRSADTDEPTAGSPRSPATPRTPARPRACIRRRGQGGRVLPRRRHAQRQVRRRHRHRHDHRHDLEHHVRRPRAGMGHEHRAAGDSIRAAATETPNIADAGTFSGQTRMGPVTGQNDHGEDVYRMTGHAMGRHLLQPHGGRRYDGRCRRAHRAPGSVAGTFGVGRADDQR